MDLAKKKAQRVTTKKTARTQGSFTWYNTLENFHFTHPPTRHAAPMRQQRCTPFHLLTGAALWMQLSKGKGAPAAIWGGNSELFIFFLSLIFIFYFNLTSRQCTNKATPQKMYEEGIIHLVKLAAMILRFLPAASLSRWRPGCDGVFRWPDHASRIFTSCTFCILLVDSSEYQWASGRLGGGVIQLQN